MIDNTKNDSAKTIYIHKVRIPKRKEILSGIYSLFTKIAPNTSRNVLLFVAAVGIIGWAVYTQFIIERLQKYSSETTETYAQLISEAFYDKIGTSLEYKILEQIVQDFDMPIIITDIMGRPRIWKNITTNNFFYHRKIAQDDYSYETMQILIAESRRLQKTYPSKLIYGRDRKTSMGFLYYGDSNFIKGISLLPYLQVFFVLSFVAVVYLILRAYLVTEQSNLWVGLAKETAHQLGTPLTSLSGWIEYLQTECENRKGDGDDFLLDSGDTDFSNLVLKISKDMSRDVARIKKVTNRFSFIGSKPLLEYTNLKPLLDEHIAYFSKRIPKESNIDIKYDCREDLPAVVNSDLFSWVLENLFKNSLDAIDSEFGEISIRAVYIKVEKKIRISHRDNGKGIPKELWNGVFTPGYTTKTRGWGLGLTLAKRIVEEYHNGKMYIAWSQVGKGTKFVIELPAVENMERNKTQHTAII